MITFDRRAALVAALVLVCYPANAALFGSKEPEQRKAFIAFLQAGVVNRPGAHLPALTDDDRKKFGDYIKHYDVLADFVSDAVIRNLSAKLSQTLSGMGSLAAVVDKRDVLRKSADDLNVIPAQINDKLEKAKVARAALKQADDLKAVYDAAFDKLITKPVQGFRDTVPAAQKSFMTSANVADYVAAHRDKINFNGNNVSGKDKKTQAELVELVGKVKADGETFAASYRRLGVILTGS